MKITENHLIVLTKTSNKNSNSNKIMNKNIDIRLVPHYVDRRSDNETFNKFFDILTLGNLYKI